MTPAAPAMGGGFAAAAGGRGPVLSIDRLAAARGVVFEDAGLPSDVERSLLLHADLERVSEKPVVMVVESADPRTTNQNVKQLLLEQQVAYTPIPVEPSFEFARARANPSVPPVTSNVMTPNAVANAIADEVTQPSLLEAKQVALRDISLLQTRLNEPSTYRYGGELGASTQSSYMAKSAKAGADAGSTAPAAAGALTADQSAGAVPQHAKVYCADLTTLRTRQTLARRQVLVVEPQANAGAPEPQTTTVRPAKAGDRLSIQVPSFARQSQQPMQQTGPIVVTVDANGFIEVPGFGTYNVAGLTPDQVANTMVGDNTPTSKDKAANEQPAKLLVTIVDDARANDRDRLAKGQDTRADDQLAQANGPKAAQKPAEVPTTRPVDADATDARVDLFICVKPAPAPTTLPTAVAEPTTAPTGVP
ncbi:MAG: polysaccharide biosynthesis/export family protein [Tepidisphaeraceae bacterium]